MPRRTEALAKRSLVVDSRALRQWVRAGGYRTEVGSRARRGGSRAGDPTDAGRHRGPPDARHLRPAPFVRRAVGVTLDTSVWVPYLRSKRYASAVDPLVGAGRVWVHGIALLELYAGTASVDDARAVDTLREA